MKKELETYIRNTARIRGLSSPQLYTVGYASEYSRMLRENFVKIGDLARENREILDDWLFPYIRSVNAIGEEEMEVLGDFGDSLLDAYNLDNLDPAILSMISEQLLATADKDASDTEIIAGLDREIMACYTMVNITGRLSQCPEIAETWRQRGFKAGERLMAYLEHDRFSTLSPEDREITMINARYLWVLYEGAILSPEEARKNYEQLVRVLELGQDPFYREMMPEYDWNNHRFRALQYLAIAVENHNRRGFPADVLRALSERVAGLETLWDTDPAYYGKLATRDEVAVFVLRCRFESGEIDRDAYYRELFSLYERRDRDDYRLSGMILNLNIPAEYMLTLDRENISEEEQDWLETFIHDILNYAFHMPAEGSLSYMLEYVSALLRSFVEIPGLFSFEELCLNCLAALHPPTYVHSMMVAEFTKCLTRHLLKRHPELFARMPEAGDPDALLSFAWHAGVCHDFGKILMIDTIYVYGRKLLDMEFGLIRRHPEEGAAMLQSHASTCRYAGIARWHHRWYDGQGGYPEGDACESLPERVILDLVTCADCLDAATDAVGRSYQQGKTLDDFLAELREGSGTRYAPWLTELLEDPAVRRDLAYLLEQGRNVSYRKTYLLLRNLQERGSVQNSEDVRFRLSPVDYHKGEVIISEGEEGNCMYEIVDGRVGIYANYGQSDEQLLSVLGPENVFGEMGMVQYAPRSASAVALDEPVRVARITWSMFEDYFKSRPSRVVQILQQSSDRLRVTTRRLVRAETAIGHVEKALREDHPDEALEQLDVYRQEAELS